MFNCVFVTFPCGILSQVGYLIVLIQICCDTKFKLSVGGSYRVIEKV